MKKMLGVPVFAYNDIQGAQISEAGTDESGRYAQNRIEWSGMHALDSVLSQK